MSYVKTINRLWENCDKRALLIELADGLAAAQVEIAELKAAQKKPAAPPKLPVEAAEVMSDKKK